MLMSKFYQILRSSSMWRFPVETAGPLAKTLDMRDFVDSFDITGRLEAGQI